MRPIDADVLCGEFKRQALSARNWKERAVMEHNDEAIIRADATLAFLSEVKLTIDNAPTIETSYDLYREETCERKAHCYDYKYWHCIGCHGCKADMRGGQDDV